jgi:ribokinase
LKYEVESLIDVLKKSRAKPEVTVMPDFFLDHFISFKGSLQSFIGKVSEIAMRGGGNIPDIKQTIMRGGNAANTASALASLGAAPRLISRTNQLGFKLLQLLVEAEGVDLSHMKKDGCMALTTALELECEGKLVNVMINNPGSVSNFGFDSLTSSDIDLIEESDFICVFNWNQNFKGTELAQKVFSQVKKRGRGKTFFDTGDPSPRKGEIKELINRVLAKGLVDIFSVNENEAIWYALHFDESFYEKRQSIKAETLAMDCASILHEKLGLRIDLHTAEYAATFIDGRKYVAPAFRVPVLRATGAGDAWNAADIYGEALKLDPMQRLMFANAAAAFYISNEEGKHASIKDVIKILRKERSYDKGQSGDVKPTNQLK